MSAPGFPFFNGLNLASISLPKNRICHCGYVHPGVPLLLGGLLKPFEAFWWLLGSLGALFGPSACQRFYSFKGQGTY